MTTTLEIATVAPTMEFTFQNTRMTDGLITFTGERFGNDWRIGFMLVTGRSSSRFINRIVVSRDNTDAPANLIDALEEFLTIVASELGLGLELFNGNITNQAAIHGSFRLTAKTT